MSSLDVDVKLLDTKQDKSLMKVTLSFDNMFHLFQSMNAAQKSCVPHPSNCEILVGPLYYPDNFSWKISSMGPLPQIVSLSGYMALAPADVQHSFHVYLFDNEDRFVAEIDQIIGFGHFNKKGGGTFGTVGR